ncbi:MAG: HpcH/HpaI aldolase family protein [Thermodesulfobacteriota bacterium]|nr:aldolase [Desulfovibrio sp.]
MLRPNFMKQKLDRGEAVIGTWAVIPSPVTAEILAVSGLDFIIIDAEHGPITFETAQAMAMACEARRVSPVMRVGEVNADAIQRALDIGMHAVQVPNIDTAERARDVIRFSKYPPQGERGFSPFTRAGGYSRENARRLTAEANANTLVGINVEGKAALDEIDAILELPELDLVFIGLYDLSKSLGVPGQVDHPDVQRLMVRLSKKINAAGKVAGTIASRKEDIRKSLDGGIRYLLYLVDCEVLRQAYSEACTLFKEACHG